MHHENTANRIQRSVSVYIKRVLDGFNSQTHSENRERDLITFVTKRSEYVK